MHSYFYNCLPHVLSHEGGKSDNPKDPGGRTYQGVTNTTFAKFLISSGMKPRDVFTMKDAERDSIYLTMYWQPIHGDELGAGVDLAVFDGAVNSGSIQSVKWLQRALGSYYTGKIDGVIGRVTLEAVQSYPNKVNLINAICDRRLNFLTALSTFSVFGKGWTRRVMEVRADALAMSKLLPLKAAAPQNSDAMVKAPIEDAKRIPTGQGGNVTAGSGGSTATIGLALEGARTAIEPLSGGNTFLTYIVVALVLSGLAMTVGGFIWRFTANKKAAKLIDHLNLLDTPNANATA